MSRLILVVSLACFASSGCSGAPAEPDAVPAEAPADVPAVSADVPALTSADVVGWGGSDGLMTKYAHVAQPIVFSAASVASVDVVTGEARSYPQDLSASSQLYVWSEAPGVSVLQFEREGGGDPVRMRFVAQEFDRHVYMEVGDDWASLGDFSATGAEIEDEEVVQVDEAGARLIAKKAGRTMALLTADGTSSLVLVDVGSTPESERPVTIELGVGDELGVDELPGNEGESSALLTPMEGAAVEIVASGERSVVRGVSPGVAFVTLTSSGRFDKIVRVNVR